MYNTKQGKREVITFTHFSRKGFALFACLGREVRIGVLSAAVIACSDMQIDAQSVKKDFGSHTDETADTLRLGESSVTASRAPLAAEMEARPVVVLTRQDLSAAGITSINDVLKMASGIDVRQRGGFGMQTDISIDGGTFDQVTLLVNGISISNPQTGHNAGDFPVNLSDIERIEILEGAASRVFGSQAFSGAINIVTRRKGEKALVGIQGGSYGTIMANARTALSKGNFSTTVSGHYGRSDGAVNNSDFKGGKAFWQGSYDDNKFSVFAQAGASLNDFGANTFYSGAYPNQWEATRRYIASVQAITKGRLKIQPSASWIRSVDHYQLTRHSSKGENFNRGDVFSLAANAWTEWLLGKTAIGAEMREEGIYSTNLGKPLDESLQIGIPGKDFNYTKHDSRTNLSYFFEHNIVLPKLTISIGALAERNTAIDNKFRWFPGIDISLRPRQGLKIFASWNKSMRLPTFTDLYYKSPTQEGNIGLKPEMNSAFRLGAEYSVSFLRLSAKAYYNRCSDMIDWIMFTPEDKYNASNFSLDNMGASVTAIIYFDELLGKKQPLKSLSLDYAYIYQKRRDDIAYYKSNYALEYLRNKFVAKLSHRIVSRLSAQWTFRLQNRVGNYLLYRNGQNTQQLTPYGTHALLDCRINWEAKHYSLFADFSNITATRYYDLGNVPQPGFMLMAGAYVKF